LNLWGNDIDEISLVSEMSELTILSLSVNKISTLVDVQYCKSLSELYLRQNNI